MTTFRHSILFAALAVCLVAVQVEARPIPMGNFFTYQGLLKQGGGKANGQFDMQFGLFDSASGGNIVCCFNGIECVNVVDGVFTVTLDYGSAFNADARWLEIWVRPCNTGNYTILAPRQIITPAPVSLFALRTDGANIFNLCAEKITCGNLNAARMPTGGFWELTSPLSIYDTLLTLDPQNYRITSGGSVKFGSNGTSFIPFEVEGPNVAAASTGSAPNGVTRHSAGGTTTVLDMGIKGSPAHAWIQSRDENSYGINYKLALNPNGGNVGIGTATPNVQLEVTGLGRFTGSGGFSIGADSNNVRIDAAGASTQKFRMLDTSNAYSGLRLKQVSVGGNFGDLDAPAEGMIVQGNVGIGTSAPAQRLQVAGNICATGSIGVCSDVRFKTDINPIDNPLDIVETLQPVRFHWRIKEFPDHQFSSDPQIGFIAQQVANSIPEVVSQGSDGYYSVDYGRLTPMLVGALQQLHEIVRDKDTQIAQVQRECQELRARMDSMERQLQRVLEHGAGADR